MLVTVTKIGGKAEKQMEHFSLVRHRGIWAEVDVALLLVNSKILHFNRVIDPRGFQLEFQYWIVCAVTVCAIRLTYSWFVILKEKTRDNSSSWGSHGCYHCCCTNKYHSCHLPDGWCTQQDFCNLDFPWMCTILLDLVPEIYIYLVLTSHMHAVLKVNHHEKMYF